MELTKLFNKDISEIIILYVGTELILSLQNYYPTLLKKITITTNDMHLIDVYNYKYVRKIVINNSRTIMHFYNITELNCSSCVNITDADICHLLNLVVLNCSNCQNITDYGIQHLLNLTELNCSNCKNITNTSITKLLYLTELDC